MEAVVQRGETEGELVVVLGGDRRYVMVVGDLEIMISGFRYFVESNGVEMVRIRGFGSGDDMYDVMMIMLCCGIRAYVVETGENLSRLVYWGENDFYRRVLVEYYRYGCQRGSSGFLRCVVEGERIRGKLGVKDRDSGVYMFECPQCKMLFMIHESELACCIARHGTDLSGVPINPHASEEVCMQLLESGKMLGCGCPVRFVKVSDGVYKCEKGLFTD